MQAVLNGTVKAPVQSADLNVTPGRFAVFRAKFLEKIPGNKIGTGIHLDGFVKIDAGRAKNIELKLTIGNEAGLRENERNPNLRVGFRRTELLNGSGQDGKKFGIGNA